MSWNKQYRPKSFSQLHLQSARETLTSLLVQPILPQAYLFTGPKGTGKTSASRILSAVLNDPRNAQSVANRLTTAVRTAGKADTLFEPDDKGELVARILSGQSLAVHELDAASNRGIDDIRALKERVFMPPQEGLVSVYILDEAHMLTNEASNALLKVLEEPPKNVVFILATTEQHKILPTIVSRCFTVSFTRATTPELQSALEHILKAEKISYEIEALTLLSKQADGSFRDAVKLLESIAASGAMVNMEAVQKKLGQQGLNTQMLELLRAIVGKHPAEVSSLFEKLRLLGLPDVVVHTVLLETLHEQLLASLGVRISVAEWSTAILQFLLHEFSSPELAIASPIPLLHLELKSLELIARSQKKQVGAEPPLITPATKPTATATSKQKSLKVEKSETPGNGKTLCERWEEFVDLVTQANTTLGAFLRSAQPEVSGVGTVVIKVFYSFHKDQLQSSKSQAMLQGFISQLCGGNLDIHIEVMKPDNVSVASRADSDTASLPALAASALM